MFPLLGNNFHYTYLGSLSVNGFVLAGLEPSIREPLWFFIPDLHLLASCGTLKWGSVGLTYLVLLD